MQRGRPSVGGNIGDTVDVYVGDSVGVHVGDSVGMLASIVASSLKS